MDLSPGEQRDAERAIAVVTQAMIDCYCKALAWTNPVFRRRAEERGEVNPWGEHYEEPEDE